jgi:hypothetical protein
LVQGGRDAGSASLPDPQTLEREENERDGLDEQVTTSVLPEVVWNVCRACVLSVVVNIKTLKRRMIAHKFKAGY